MPADAFVPSDARLSTNTALITKLDAHFQTPFGYQLFRVILDWADGFFKWVDEI